MIGIILLTQKKDFFSIVYPYREKLVPNCFIHNTISKPVGIYDPKSEITNEQFQRHLDKITGIKYKSPEEFVSKINTFFEEKFSLISACNYHNTRLLNIIRPNKEHGFQILLSIKGDDIETIKIVGNPLEEYASILTDKKLRDTRIPFENEVNDDKLTFIDDNLSILIPNDEKKRTLIDLLHRKKKFVSYSSYRCYNNSNYVRKDFCEGVKGYYGEQKSPMVWDKPCVTNEDCPFFKTNTNYPNKRGGCNGGFCEMPINIKQLSYRMYDKSIEPYCYNCNPADGKYICCKAQEEKKRPEYQFMTSPDYAFPGDLTERFKYVDELGVKGLSVLY
jgi:hypothetical protein